MIGAAMAAIAGGIAGGRRRGGLEIVEDVVDEDE
jgi:hypothetical protein